MQAEIIDYEIHHRFRCCSWAITAGMLMDNFGFPAVGLVMSSVVVVALFFVLVFVKDKKFKFYFKRIFMREDE